MRRQRESASGKGAASVVTRSGSPSAGAAAFKRGGAESLCAAASLESVLDKVRLAWQEGSTAFRNRQVPA
ncbi:MAG TPA: hypothetical protein VGB76_03085 [Pyrinomonadaceae bacterium]